jgi:hypothetical protein
LFRKSFSNRKFLSNSQGRAKDKWAKHKKAAILPDLRLYYTFLPLGATGFRQSAPNTRPKPRLSPAKAGGNFAFCTKLAGNWCKFRLNPAEYPRRGRGRGVIVAVA